jgi:heme/copper-type cytochrome/quinol oxidase subunit 2
MSVRSTVTPASVSVDGGAGYPVLRLGTSLCSCSRTGRRRQRSAGTAIGQQFAWKFEYPDNGDVKSGELVLPVGRQAHFTMKAVDVLHSFWVPQFGQKMDAVPGIETFINVTPTRTGEFAVVCAELCGLGHATMRAKARVVTQAEFDKWIEEQRA